jgi:hypothetical protein
MEQTEQQQTCNCDSELKIENVREFSTYNHRRYGRPWIAIFDTKELCLDFSVNVGGYSGTNGGEGHLYLTNPQNGQIFGYGQKDNRGSRTLVRYIVCKKGKLIGITKDRLIRLIEEGKFEDFLSSDKR